jgi:hypothetical protein
MVGDLGEIQDHAERCEPTPFARLCGLIEENNSLRYLAAIMAASLFPALLKAYIEGQEQHSRDEISGDVSADPAIYRHYLYGRIEAEELLASFEPIPTISSIVQPTAPSPILIILRAASVLGAGNLKFLNNWLEAERAIV